MKGKLHSYFQDPLKAVELCLDRDLINPALVLIYSTIDATAWLWADPTETSNRRYFEAWVDEFMLPAEGVPCRSVDLWAARSGLLHRLTSDSDLAARGLATPLAYACREADTKELQAKADGRFIAVHVEALNRALIEALVKFIESLGPANPRTPLAMERASSYFEVLDEDDIDAAVKPANPLQG